MHSLFAKCQRPALADLAGLDSAAHIGDAPNVEILLLIIDTQTGELEDFSAALACYEAQAEPSGGIHDR